MMKFRKTSASKPSSEKTSNDNSRSSSVNGSLNNLRKSGSNASLASAKSVDSKNSPHKSTPNQSISKLKDTSTGSQDKLKRSSSADKLNDINRSSKDKLYGSRDGLNEPKDKPASLDTQKDKSQVENGVKPSHKKENLAISSGKPWSIDRDGSDLSVHIHTEPSDYKSSSGNKSSSDTKSSSENERRIVHNQSNKTIKYYKHGNNKGNIPPPRGSTHSALQTGSIPEDGELNGEDILRDLEDPHKWWTMWHSNPRMSMSFVQSKGLLNAPGENNCFLNSAVQVLWHLDVFRRSFRLLSGHSCMGNSCIFCALKVIFTQFQYSDQTALPPDALRKALAKTFKDQQRYQLGLMDDAAECFENILTRIHSHITPNIAEDTCTAPHCISHQKFAQTLVEQLQCAGCGASSEPHVFNQMVQYVSTSALCGTNEDMKRDPRYRDEKDHRFAELLKNASSQGDTRNCPSKCGQRAKIRRNLTNCPEVVSVGLIWDSDRPTLRHITDVIQCIGTRLRLPDLFDSVANRDWASSAELHLVGVVCYYGKHYSTFFFHSKKAEWISFDDATVKQMGTWPQVADKCCRGHYQPLLLLYANPRVIPIDMQTAPDKTTMVDGHSFNNDPSVSPRDEASPHSRQGSASSTDRQLRPGGQNPNPSHPTTHFLAADSGPNYSSRTLPAAQKQPQRSRTPDPDDYLRGYNNAPEMRQRSVTPGPEWGRYDSNEDLNPVGGQSTDGDAVTGGHYRQSSYLSAMEAAGLDGKVKSHDHYSNTQNQQYSNYGNNNAAGRDNQVNSGSQGAYLIPDVSSNNKRYEGTQHPVSGTQHPVSGTQHPVAGTQHPVAGTQHPSKQLNRSYDELDQGGGYRLIQHAQPTAQYNPQYPYPSQGLPNQTADPGIPATRTHSSEEGNRSNKAVMSQNRPQSAHTKPQGHIQGQYPPNTGHYDPRTGPSYPQPRTSTSSNPQAGYNGSGVGYERVEYANVPNSKQSYPSQYSNNSAYPSAASQSQDSYQNVPSSSQGSYQHTQTVPNSSSSGPYNQQSYPPQVSTSQHTGGYTNHNHIPQYHNTATNNQYQNPSNTTNNQYQNQNPSNTTNNHYQNQNPSNTTNNHYQNQNSSNPTNNQFQNQNPSNATNNQFQNQNPSNATNNQYQNQNLSNTTKNPNLASTNHQQTGSNDSDNYGTYINRKAVEKLMGMRKPAGPSNKAFLSSQQGEMYSVNSSVSTTLSSGTQSGSTSHPLGLRVDIPDNDSQKDSGYRSGGSAGDRNSSSSNNSTAIDSPVTAGNQDYRAFPMIQALTSQFGNQYSNIQTGASNYNQPERPPSATSSNNSGYQGPLPTSPSNSGYQGPLPTSPSNSGYHGSAPISSSNTHSGYQVAPGYPAGPPPVTACQRTTAIDGRRFSSEESLSSASAGSMGTVRTLERAGGGAPGLSHSQESLAVIEDNTRPVKDLINKLDKTQLTQPPIPSHKPPAIHPSHKLTHPNTATHPSHKPPHTSTHPSHKPSQPSYKPPQAPHKPSQGYGASATPPATQGYGATSTSTSSQRGPVVSQQQQPAADDQWRPPSRSQVDVPSDHRSEVVLPTDALYMQAEGLMELSNKRELEGDVASALICCQQAIGHLQQLLSQPGVPDNTKTHVRVKHSSCVMRTRSLHKKIQLSRQESHTSTVSNNSDDRHSYSSTSPESGSRDFPLGGVAASIVRTHTPAPDTEFTHYSQRNSKYVSDYVSREEYFAHHPPPPQRVSSKPVSAPKPCVPPKPPAKPGLKHSVSIENQLCTVNATHPGRPPRDSDEESINIYATLPRRPKTRERSATLTGCEQKQVYQAYVDNQNSSGKSSSGKSSIKNVIAMHESVASKPPVPPPAPGSGLISHTRQWSKDEIRELLVQDYRQRGAAAGGHPASIQTLVDAQMEQFTSLKSAAKLAATSKHRNQPLNQHSNQSNQYSNPPVNQYGHQSNQLGNQSSQQVNQYGNQRDNTNNSNSDNSNQTEPGKTPHIQRVLPQQAVPPSRSNHPSEVAPPPLGRYVTTGRGGALSPVGPDFPPSGGDGLSRLEAHELALQHGPHRLENGTFAFDTRYDLHKPEVPGSPKKTGSRMGRTPGSPHKGRVALPVPPPQIPATYAQNQPTHGNENQHNNHTISALPAPAPTPEEFCLALSEEDLPPPPPELLAPPELEPEQLVPCETHFSAPTADGFRSMDVYVIPGPKSIAESKMALPPFSKPPIHNHISHDRDLADFCVIENADDLSSSGIERTDTQSDTSSVSTANSRNSRGSRTSSGKPAKPALVKKVKKHRPRKSVTFNENIMLIAKAEEIEAETRKEPDYMAYVQDLLKRSPGKSHPQKNSSSTSPTDSSKTKVVIVNDNPVMTALPSGKNDIPDQGGKTGYDSDFDEDTSDSCTSDEITNTDRVQCNLCRKKLISPGDMYCGDCSAYMAQFQPAT